MPLWYYKLTHQVWLNSNWQLTQVTQQSFPDKMTQKSEIDSYHYHNNSSTRKIKVQQKRSSYSRWKFYIKQIFTEIEGKICQNDSITLWDSAQLNLHAIQRVSLITDITLSADVVITKLSSCGTILMLVTCIKGHEK